MQSTPNAFRPTITSPRDNRIGIMLTILFSSLRFDAGHGGRSSVRLVVAVEASGRCDAPPTSADDVLRAPSRDCRYRLHPRGRTR
jgi:hypothetical protein